MRHRARLQAGQAWGYCLHSPVRAVGVLDADQPLGYRAGCRRWVASGVALEEDPEEGGCFHRGNLGCSLNHL